MKLFIRYILVLLTVVSAVHAFVGPVISNSRNGLEITSSQQRFQNLQSIQANNRLPPNFPQHMQRAFIVLQNVLRNLPQNVQRLRASNFQQNLQTASTFAQYTQRASNFPQSAQNFEQSGTKMPMSDMMKGMTGEKEKEYKDPAEELKAKLPMSDNLIEAAAIVLLEGYLLPRCRSVLAGGTQTTTIFQAYLNNDLCTKIGANLLFKLFSV